MIERPPSQGVLLHLRLPGARVVGAFVGEPHVETLDAGTRVLWNFFVPADGSMRVLAGDEIWLRQTQKAFAKFGREGILYEVAFVGPDPERCTLLPDRKATADDETRLRLTPRYDLALLAAGELDPRTVHRTPTTVPTPRDESVEGDLTGGLVFAHTLAMQTKYSTFDARVRLQATIEELVAQGALDLQRLEARQKQVREREAARWAQQTIVRLSENVDKYALTDLPQIDCASRLHLCKARCCSLTFHLSPQDLDERVVAWEYGRPYTIRHTAEGFCVHNDRETCGCGVYTQRPAICRTYDCRRDTRIWQDFENRIPATRAADDPAPDASMAPEPAET
jgi:Fe-S-cluster containining protein